MMRSSIKYCNLLLQYSLQKILSQNIDDYKKKFEADGFVIIKNIVPLEQINYIYEAIFHLLQKYSPEITKKIEGDKPWLDLKFHNELGRF